MVFGSREDPRTSNADADLINPGINAKCGKVNPRAARPGPTWRFAWSQGGVLNRDPLSVLKSIKVHGWLRKRSSASHLSDLIRSAPLPGTLPPPKHLFPELFGV